MGQRSQDLSRAGKLVPRKKRKVSLGCGTCKSGALHQKDGTHKPRPILPSPPVKILLPCPPNQSAPVCRGEVGGGQRSRPFQGW